MRICLVRHGQTDWNAEGRWQGHEDIPLNELGREQAQFAALLLAKYEWAKVFSSPLQRALETAQIIATAIDISKKPKILDDLRERHMGEASGLTKEERQEKFPDGVVSDAEDLEEVAERGITALNTIAEEHSEENVIVVAHGGIIRAILRSLLGDKCDENLKMENLSMSMLEKSGDAFEVVFYNKTASEIKNESSIGDVEKLNKP